MQQNELISLLCPPFQTDLCQKFLGYYIDAKSDQIIGRWPEAITKYGKFLEFVAKSIYLHVTNDKTDYSCSHYTKNIRNKTQLPDSVRRYIPAAIDSAYNIRNNRDAAHASLNIDSNIHDCNYSSATCDWILGELLVEFGSKDRKNINQLLQTISTRRLPLVFRNSEGRPIVLTPQNPAWLNSLILLYTEKRPLDVLEISKSIDESQDNIRKQLNSKKNMVCKLSDGRYELLPHGALEVERIMIQKGN